MLHFSVSVIHLSFVEQNFCAARSEGFKRKNFPKNIDKKKYIEHQTNMLNTWYLKHTKARSLSIQMSSKVFFWPGAFQWRIYYHDSCGKLSTTCCNATEVAQWAASGCSWPQSATDNGVRDGRSNWLAVTPHPLQGSTPECHFHMHMRAINKECCQLIRIGRGK